MSFKQCRKNAGFTQTEVAEKMGVRQGTVSSWEAKYTNPKVPQLVFMAELYGCTIDELVSDIPTISIIKEEGKMYEQNKM